MKFFFLVLDNLHISPLIYSISLFIYLMDTARNLIYYFQVASSVLLIVFFVIFIQEDNDYSTSRQGTGYMIEKKGHAVSCLHIRPGNR